MAVRPNHPYAKTLNRIEDERRLLSLVNLSAPRDWVAYGRKHSEIACALDVAGERIWVLFDGHSVHGPRRELPSHHRGIRPAQLRFSEAAELALPRLVAQAKQWIAEWDALH